MLLVRLRSLVVVVALVATGLSSGTGLAAASSAPPAGPPAATTAKPAPVAPVGITTLGLSGWTVQSSENATQTGDQISTPGFSTAGWLDVTPDDAGAPGTEVGAILQDVTTAENASPTQLVAPGCATAPVTVPVTGATTDSLDLAVTNATYSTTTHLVTLTFASQPAIPKVGALISVSGITPGAYNVSNVQIISSTATTLTYGLPTSPGAFTSGGTVAISRATVTFAPQSGASVVGLPIVVAGIDPSGYNGTFSTLASTSSSVTYFLGNSVGAFTSGGTVSLNLPTDVSSANVFYSNNLDTCFGPLKTSEGALSASSRFAKPWWFRTDFSSSLEAGQSARLVINGVMGQADVWLNGTEVASQATVQGAFTSYSFDVTDLLRTGTNALAIEMFANNASTMLTFDVVDWSQIPPDNNTGIQFPVELHVSRALEISNAHVMQNDSEDLSQADLTVLADLTNNTSSPQTGKVTATITPPKGPKIDVSQTVTVAARSTRTVTFTPADYHKLSIKHPDLWWPYQMGDQPLYTLSMDVAQGKTVSDTAPDVTFGIRTITTYVTPPSTFGAQSLQYGSRVFVVNGVAFDYRAGGWSEDLFLRYSTMDEADQIAVIKGLGLNGIRTEGKEMPQDWYQQMDRAGLLIDAGFTCCDKWEPSSNGSGVTANEYTVIYLSSYTIGQRLRDHPSILNYSYSDNAPTRMQEIWSNMGFNAAGFQDPIISSAEYKTSGVLGVAGEKEGPYDWVPPSYWYDNTHPSSGDSSLTNNGGAWGFDSETGPGHTMATIDSLDRFLSPADQSILWQYPGAHQFHTNYESVTANCPPASSTLTLGVSNATYNAGTGIATVTFLPTVPTAPMVGSEVTVAGVDPAGYNGTFTITASSTTTVGFALASDPGAFTSGGTVVIPSGWSTTCNASHSGYSFGSLSNLNISIARRYGNWYSESQYVEQAQVSNYENLRSLFEAYLDHWTNPSSPSTGLDYWQLNKGWPTLLWNIYNNDYDQAGAYFGAAKANENLHVFFAYDDGTVAIDNLTGSTQKDLSVEATVYDLGGNVLDRQTAGKLSLPTQGVRNAVITPHVPATTTPPTPAQTYFVELVLKQKNEVVDRNVYWLSTQQDVVNWASSIGNPQATMTQYGDLRGLQSLSPTSVQASASTESKDGTSTTTIRITNPSTNPAVAFFLRADVRRGNPNGTEQAGDNQVLPVTWSDNDITLWPGQSQVLTATYNASLVKGATPVVSISGWNVAGFDVVAAKGPAPKKPGPGITDFGTADGTPKKSDAPKPNDGIGPGVQAGPPLAGPSGLVVSAVANKPAFAQGDAAGAGDRYTLMVSNPTADAATSTVTVTSILGSGLTLVSGSMSGSGWSCSGSTCTRSDPLSPGDAYPPITLGVTIGATAGYGTHSNQTGLEVTDGASVAGGFGAGSPTRFTATATPIVGMANLTAFNYVASAFVKGDVGDLYQITVQNQGAGPTIANVPITGASWSGGTATITFPPLVSAPATGQAIAVSGVDPAGYNGAFSITAATASSISFALASDPGAYTGGGTLSMPIVATITALPATIAGITATGLYGSGWTCNLGPITTPYNLPARSCYRMDVLQGENGEAPPITLVVNTNTATTGSAGNQTVRVSGGFDRVAAASVNSATTVVAAPAAPAVPPTLDPAPVLTVASGHAGSFGQGGSGMYSLVVSNDSGGAPTQGRVTVVDTLPPGLDASRVVGVGWTCNLLPVFPTTPSPNLFPKVSSCWRSDPLAPGASYPAITLTVGVADNAQPSVTNAVTVYGGGMASPGSSADVTSITQMADLTVTAIASGGGVQYAPFAQGDGAAANDTYGIVVANVGFAPTSGTMEMALMLPAGLTAIAMSGDGWSCATGTTACTRTTPLSPGDQSVITLQVDVTADSPLFLPTYMRVSGGGQIEFANDSYIDPTFVKAR